MPSKQEEIKMLKGLIKDNRRERRFLLIEQRKYRIELKELQEKT